MKLTTIVNAISTAAALLFSAAGWAANDTRLTIGAVVLAAGERTASSDQTMLFEFEAGNIINHRTLSPTLLVVLHGDNPIKAAATGEPGRMMEEQRNDRVLVRDELIAPGRLIWSVDGKPVGRIVAIERDGESVVILRNEGVIAFKPEHFDVVDDRLVALFTRGHIDKYTKPVPNVLRQMLAGMSPR
jgi:hypothetical protein